MNALSFRLGWPLYTGMAVAGAASVVASASTLAALARTAGWSGWTPWLLPAALDIGGCAGGWCWLRPGVPEPARRFGRLVALAGAAGSLIGNAAGHLLTTGYLSAGPVLVVIVGAVPAAVLVALAHLATLLTVPPAANPSTKPGSPGEAQAEPIDEMKDADTSSQTSGKQFHANDPSDAGQADLEQRDDPGEQTETDDQTEPNQQGEIGELSDIDEPDDQQDEDRHEEQDEQEETADTRDAVLQLLHQNALTIAELAKATDRSRTTVIGHLAALTSAGAVHRDDTKRYRATARPHLIQTQQSGPEEATR